MERNFFCRDPLTQESWLAPSTRLQLVWALSDGHFCQKRLCCKTTRPQSLHTTTHPRARAPLSLALKTTHKVPLHYVLHVVSVWKAGSSVFRLSWQEWTVWRSPGGARAVRAVRRCCANLHLAVSQHDSGSGIQICVGFGGFLLGVGKITQPASLCP